MNRQSFSKPNCLNLIRIIAAFQVMLGHLIEHLELPINDTIFCITYFFRGVPIFFTLSGFLMWFSIGKAKSYKQYLRKRFWRIYPELWMAIFIELIVLIVLYHGWDLKSMMLFILGQGTIFQFWTPDSLRMYGVGTPNGTLWTMSVMIQFYIIVWFFYKIMVSRKLMTWVIGFAISFIISLGINCVTHEVIGKELIVKLYDQTFIKYFWLFYIGMFIAEFRKQLLPILQKFWYLCLIIAIIFFWIKFDLFSGYYLGWSVFLVAGLIGFAYQFPKLDISPDISYGVFLYHMTIVNIFVNFGWIGNWFYTIPIIIVTVILAYTSTITIGKISLSKKRKIEVT